MHISFITNTLAATPIRPLFKGNSDASKCSDCNGCSDCQDDIETKSLSNEIDNKGLSEDKFEKISTEQ